LVVGLSWGVFVTAVFDVKEFGTEERFEYIKYFLTSWGFWVAFGLGKDTVIFAVLYMVQMCFAEPDDAIEEELKQMEEDEANDDLSSAELFAKLHATQKKRKGKKSPAKTPKAASASTPAKSGSRTPAKSAKKADKRTYLAPHELPTEVG
jgi:hypothetical protein